MVKRSKKNNKLKGGKPFVGKFCKEISDLLGHTDFVNSVAFNSSGNLLATGSFDTTAKLWCFNPDGTNPVCNGTTTNVNDSITNYVWSVAFHPSRNLLAIAGSFDKTAKLWSFNPDGSNPVCIETLRGHTKPVRSVAFHPSRNLLATCSDDNTAKLWSFHPDGSNPVCTATTDFNGHNDRLLHLAFHPSRNLLATGSLEGRAKLWSFNPDGLNLVCTDTTNVNVHTNRVNSVAFHSSLNILATGSSDKTAKLWLFNDDGTNLICISTLLGHSEPVYSVTFYPDGNFLATGSGDNTAKLWSFRADRSNPVCIETLTGHTDWVRSVAFHPDGHFLATGSFDGTAKLWDCSKLSTEYRRRLALTHGRLSTSIIGKLTESPEVESNQSLIRSRIHQRVGNVLEINTPASRAYPDRMKAQKYLEFLPRESLHQGLPPSPVIDTPLLPLVEAPRVSSFCAVDDTSCKGLYVAIPWLELNSIPGDCAEASDLLEKLVRLKGLLESSIMDEKDSKLSLTTLWIKKLRNKIDQCRR